MLSPSSVPSGTLVVVLFLFVSFVVGLDAKDPLGYREARLWSLAVFVPLLVTEFTSVLPAGGGTLLGTVAIVAYVVRRVVGDETGAASASDT